MNTTEINAIINALDRELCYLNTKITKLVDADWDNEASKEELDLCSREHHVQVVIDELVAKLSDAGLLFASDDGESHLRAMEAFACGGLNGYNEANNHGTIEDNYR